ncbi:Pyridoxal-dependent decarboxylase conserved domain-containing protein [Paracoccus halophilus]|uniref:Pyridoxal-dependent decarboxylase conserved domain-containing protein n=1 Tax=Paracoccus halophilus TaxID=376733 RepID=A0A1I0TJ87_9RHOB|nr:pyridoxal-dependent decarboxylase [Paracoccus halophilus]SFA51839.1 Pyridoxal-dependent decarboxylase conserved domain-containing protein [Paracoccus halophilus]
MTGRPNPALLAALDDAAGQPQDRLFALSPPAAPGALSAWFLGPKAENEQVLRALVDQAISGHVAARRDYAPGDPRLGRDELFRTAAHHDTVALIKAQLDRMIRSMAGSIPLSSYRNQSHMYWDTTLPGVAGYFAGLLFNQNNVAVEASPVTTLLEIEVGRDLCRMVGFDHPERQPWGHITCDGSVANAEAIWAARNLKYLPLAIAAALREVPQLAAARDLSVPHAQGRQKLLELDPWQLMNLPVQAVIDLSGAVARAAGVTAADVTAALADRNVQDIGLHEMHRLYAPDLPTPLILTPATAHYSWPKGAALLGLGRAARVSLPVDDNGRIEVPALRRILDDCLRRRQPVMMAVGVLGTTEEGAVDPLDRIADLRDEFTGRGLSFALHADAAWGGYFAAMLRPSKLGGADDLIIDDSDKDAPPGMHLGAAVEGRFHAAARCETLTVDPHKAGFIPYPAGALCYRDGTMRDLVTFTAPVVFHDGVVPSMGVYGIEGSKPGAAPAAVWLSHAVIPPDQSGYGRLLAKCIFASRRFYAALVAHFPPEGAITVTPFQRLPAERRGQGAEAVALETRRLREEIACVEDDILLERLRADPALMRLFREIGSDTSIVTYAFNFRTSQGLNRDLGLMNRLNEAIFHALSLERVVPGELPDKPMFVTASEFTADTYGQDFIDRFAARAGVVAPPGMGVRFLISTQQNPFLTATAEGDFIPRLMQILDATARDAAARICDEHGLRLHSDQKGRR